MSSDAQVHGDDHVVTATLFLSISRGGEPKVEAPKRNDPASAIRRVCSKVLTEAEEVKLVKRNA